MTESALKLDWLRALAVAADAVEAGARAHTLPADEIGSHRRRLASERAWVETVDWSAAEPISRGTIAILEPRPKPASPSVIRSAA